MSSASGTRRHALTAADGNRLLAFSATAIDPDAAGVVVLPDVRGLHPFSEELVVRLADVGIHATAIDYFGRTAGTEDRGEGFDHVPHLDGLTLEGLMADIAAGVEHVRTSAPAVFTMGFSMGGWLSFDQAAERDDLTGVIGLYGRLQGREPDDPYAPVRLAPSYRCPVLGLFGGADTGIPVSEVDRFRRALDDAGVPNEIVVYDGAPHSFFDWPGQEHRDAREDAWRRILTFVRRLSI